MGFHDEEYIVLIHKTAKKQLESLQPNIKKKIKDKLLLLSNPFSINELKKVRGEENVYRIRVGDYRIIFLIDKKKACRYK